MKNSWLWAPPRRTILGDASTAPFGESYNAAPGIGGGEPSFTGQYQDHAGDLFDFPARVVHCNRCSLDPDSR
jgi:hypothetical protein